MSGPKPLEITLTEDERAALERLIRAHTTGRQPPAGRSASGRGARWPAKSSRGASPTASLRAMAKLFKWTYQGKPLHV